MKKVLSGVLTITLTLLGFIGLSFATIAPASAGNPEDDKVLICHYDEGNRVYKDNLVPKNAIINPSSGKPSGHGANDGVHDQDIIAPFSYNFGGSIHGGFSKNWVDNPENQAIYENGCRAISEELTPILPVSPVLTCVNPNATLTLPKQPSGVNVTSATDGKGTYTVLFELPKNTPTKSYTFPVGFQNPVTITTIDNRPSDQYWDAEKGACNLPDTGLFGLSTEVTYLGGGLLALGARFVPGTAISRRRNA